VIRGGCDPIPLDKGGPVLGVLPGSAYESARIHLQTGDVLLQRLARIVSSHLQQTPSELIDTIYASVIEFQGTSVLADDLTLVVLKVL